MTAKKQNKEQKQGYQKGLSIRVAKTTLVDFQKIFQEYRIAIFSYNFLKKSEKEFLVDTLSYWEMKLGKDFKEADKIFIESVKKPGNRKTDRSFAMDKTESTFFGLKAWEYDRYFDVMFSYVEKNKSKKGFDASVYSTSYFFYDVVDYAKKNIQGIIKIHIEKEENLKNEE